MGMSHYQRRIPQKQLVKRCIVAAGERGKKDPAEPTRVLMGVPKPILCVFGASRVVGVAGPSPNVTPGYDRFKVGVVPGLKSNLETLMSDVRSRRSYLHINIITAYVDDRRT